MTQFTFTLVTQDRAQHTAVIDVEPQDAWQRRWVTIDGGLLGIHLYVSLDTTFDLRVGVRISNGCTRKDGTGFRGRVYYTSIMVRAGDLSLFSVEPGLHVFPPRAIIERRVTLHKDTGVVTNGWRYDDDLYINTEHFGPAHELLPPVNRAHYAQAFGAMVPQLRDALNRGVRRTLYPWGVNGPAPAIDLRTDALGPFLPDGYPDPGAPAGYGIDACIGWEQCIEAVNFASMAHQCSMDRNPVACYDIDTGEIITCTDWTWNHLAHGQVATGEFGAQQNKIELPAFLIGDFSNYHYSNANGGACSYQSALEEYQPDNNEHLIRALRRACILADYVNDPMAQDDINAVFEHHRTLTFGDRGDDIVGSQPALGGGFTLFYANGTTAHAASVPYIHPSLSKLTYYAGVNPGHGAQVLRSFGWVMMFGAWAGAPASWLKRAIDAYIAICDRFGLAQREAHLPFIPAGWQGTQHFHTVLIHIGAWTAARCSGYRTDDVRNTIDRWQQFVLSNRTLPLQQRPGSTVYGPPKWIFTQGPHGEVPALAANLTNEGGFQEHVLALVGRHAQTYLNAGDSEGAKRELISGLGLEVACGSLAAKLSQMRSHTGDQNQYASYWAALEKALS